MRQKPLRREQRQQISTKTRMAYEVLLPPVFIKQFKIIYMNEYALAQLNELCQMVDRGCKPVALISVRVAEYQKAIDVIYKEYTLHALGKQLNESFFSVFIFKNYDLRFVLDLLPDKPKTPADHALLGYLFGYDTDSICNYIIKHCELNEPNLI